jgi:hypothetical protein
MKHALNPICASAVPLVRLVRGGAAACALVLLAAASAHAQRQDPVPDRRDERMQQDARFERAPEQAREQRFDPRSFDSREFDQRRQQQMQDQNLRNAEARRSGRLTPDERRDLRRQINEAGMDLYPNAQRR